MIIEIPQNDYVKPTEIRQQAVQAICNAFLQRSQVEPYHPYSDGCYRPSNNYASLCNHGSFADRNDIKGKEHKYIRFNGAEMKAAFAALIKAGYHIFQIYQYGSWMGYMLSKKPFMQQGKEVFEFNDFID